LAFIKKSHFILRHSRAHDDGIYLVNKYDVACNARLSFSQSGIFAFCFKVYLSPCFFIPDIYKRPRCRSPTFPNRILDFQKTLGGKANEKLSGQRLRAE
jgi:hypothetical protein